LSGENQALIRPPSWSFGRGAAKPRATAGSEGIMIQQLSMSRISNGSGVPAAAIPLAIFIWALSYLAIDTIMWAGGRSTLVSNIVISLPMMLTAPVLTLGLERLRRHLLHLHPALIAAILCPAAFGAAIVQGVVDYSSVR